MRLRILWKLPPRPTPVGCLTLSFLPPAEEERLRAGSAAGILNGREEAVTTRPLALRAYREIIAQMGIAQSASGRTLRQQMSTPGQASAWWFHEIAFRDPERSPVFGWLVQIFAIKRVIEMNGVRRLTVCGAPPSVTKILRQLVAQVDEVGSERRESCWKLVVRSLAHRIWFTLRTGIYAARVRRRTRVPTQRLDIVLCGFWDWSVKSDEKTGQLVDRYFRRIPRLLESAFSGSVGYFAWYDPHYESRGQKRQIDDVLRPLADRCDIVILQRYIGVFDLWAVFWDFKPLRALTLARWKGSLREIAMHDAVDWSALFWPTLLGGCLNHRILYCALVARATERAAKLCRPKLTLSFLELFPHARAHYEGMRRSGVGAVNCAMQHASICREKTFYYLHPSIEYAGEPDGCVVPKPDYVFVMGTLAEEILGEAGFPADRIRLTGSARYDNVRFRPQLEAEAARDSATPLRVLMACSLEVELEMLMVEAVCLAVRRLEGFALRVRNHPFSRVDTHARFSAYRQDLEISIGTLESDLAWADVVVFSYSTVADEAWLLGKPAWQWLPVGFNGSALVEAVDVPQFGSVVALTNAFRNLARDYRKQAPSLKEREIAARRLFAPADGAAAERITTECVRLCVAGRTESHCVSNGL